MQRGVLVTALVRCTRVQVELPFGYGRGSSTLRSWISEQAWRVYQVRPRQYTCTRTHTHTCTYAYAGTSAYTMGVSVPGAGSGVHGRARAEGLRRAGRLDLPSLVGQAARDSDERPPRPARRVRPRLLDARRLDRGAHEGGQPEPTSARAHPVPRAVRRAAVAYVERFRARLVCGVRHSHGPTIAVERGEGLGLRGGLCRWSCTGRRYSRYAGYDTGAGCACRS